MLQKLLMGGNSLVAGINTREFLLAQGEKKDPGTDWNPTNLYDTFSQWREDMKGGSSSPVTKTADKDSFFKGLARLADCSQASGVQVKRSATTRSYVICWEKLVAFLRAPPN